MVASTVSSKFLKAMAEKEGFLFQVTSLPAARNCPRPFVCTTGSQDTLTGFKWMGNAAVEGMAKVLPRLFNVVERTPELRDPRSCAGPDVPVCLRSRDRYGSRVPCSSDCADHRWCAGFAFGGLSVDKDGVRAAAIFSV